MLSVWGVVIFSKYFSGLPARKISKKNTPPPMNLGCPYPYMDTSRFARNLNLLVLGYDCTPISDLKVERINSGHNGLFARLLLIVLACLKYFVSDRFCKHRFDLFPSALTALELSATKNIHIAIAPSVSNIFSE